MALLLPSTFAMHPATALIMLAGIYYGAMYGGSTTSILVNVPGEAGSVVTLLDGYQMTRKGRAGAALTIAAVASFVAGTVGVVGIMLAAGWLADVAIQFGPPEYFAITLGGLLLLSRLSGGSILNAFVMVALGLALGTVGMDSISALRRFTFGSVQLAQGIELVPVIMGVYGVAEVLLLAEEGIAKAQIASVKLASSCRRARNGGARRCRSRAAPSSASSPGSCPAPPPCCRPSSRMPSRSECRRRPRSSAPA
jgi:putative tricarboxylic transport membrane protein